MAQSRAAFHLPKNRTICLLLRANGGIVHNVDQALVIGIALFVSGKLPRSVLAAKITSMPGTDAIFSAFATPIAPP